MLCKELPQIAIKLFVFNHYHHLDMFDKAWGIIFKKDSLIKDIDDGTFDYAKVKKYFTTGKECLCPLFKTLEPSFTDYIMSHYCKLNAENRVVTIYPIAYNQLNKIIPVLKKHGNILYRKSLNVNKEQMKTILWSYYIREKRMGHYPQGNAFLKDKVKSTYTDKPLTVMIFEPFNQKEVKTMKQGIRDICKHGFHSIHINDKPIETIQMMRFLFNNNSIENYNKKFTHLHPKKIKTLFDFIEKYNTLSVQDQDSILLDVSFLTKDRELEYEVFSKNKNLPSISETLGSPRKERKYRDKDIYSPEKHFYLFGVKCVPVDVKLPS
jgi:hypothetical protein